MRHFIDAIDGSLVRDGITTIGEDWSGADRRASERRRDEVTVSASAQNLGNAGAFVFGYGLLAIFVWAGLLKFADHEAKIIEPMLTDSVNWS